MSPLYCSRSVYQIPPPDHLSTPLEYLSQAMYSQHASSVVERSRTRTVALAVGSNEAKEGLKAVMSAANIWRALAVYRAFRSPGNEQTINLLMEKSSRWKSVLWVEIESWQRVR